MSSYCPRSSLPTKVLAWLAGRLAHLLPARPPGRGGTPPLPLEVRLDVVAAVVLDGLSYRRAGRLVGISKTEVGDSLDLLLGELAALGYCQPDGSFITTLADLRQHLAEMARSGQAVCVDGLATRVQRPSGWANQKVLYDAKRHAHIAQGLVAVSTVWGDLLWVDGAGRAAATSTSWWNCRGCGRRWTPPVSPPSWTGGFGAWPRIAFTGMRRSGTDAPRTASPAGSGRSTACRRACARWWSSRPSGQRVGAAPLAGPAVSGPGGLPGRWRAGLSGPVAAPGTPVKKHHCRVRPQMLLTLTPPGFPRQLTTRCADWS